MRDDKTLNKEVVSWALQNEFSFSERLLERIVGVIWASQGLYDSYQRRDPTDINSQKEKIISEMMSIQMTFYETVAIFDTVSGSVKLEGRWKSADAEQAFNNLREILLRDSTDNH